jgi:membrane protein YqaA with SNARE-associated domain
LDAIINHLFQFFARMGGMGLLFLGALDSSILILPLGNDLLMVALTAYNPENLPYYVAMSTVGSVAGIMTVEWVSRKGGEAGLERRMNPKQLERMKRRVNNRAALALATGALLPPPFPFKLLVAAAAAFQYPRKRLLIIVAVMRAVRFTLIGLLALWFGTRIIAIAESPWVRYSVAALVVFSIAASIVSVYRMLRKGRQRDSAGDAPPGEAVPAPES